MLARDRARLWYQFEFAAETDIAGDGDVADAQTYKAIYLHSLGAYEGANINLDAIDPMADPNLQSPGPDGRIEVKAVVDQPAT